MEQKETLGRRIAALRKEKGLTQEQLAEKVGVSAQAVSKWENDISCPDITLLPLLAELFGVSVDELLGVKPVEPHVVIINKEESGESDSKKGFEFEWGNSRRSKSWHTIALCIGAILICLFYILHNMAGLFPYIESESVTLKDWNYIWPLLVFTFGMMSIPSSIPVGVTLTLFGAYEFVRRALIPYGVDLVAIPWSVVVMILAILILLMIILGKLHILPKFRKRSKADSPTLEYSSENDHLKADMSFGNNHIHYDRAHLNGGEIDSSFGDYTIDFRDVTSFSPNCVLEIDQNFGNITVLLPKIVRLVKKSDTSFAAFTQVGNPDPDAPYTMVINADVNFGSLQIKYGEE